MRVIREVFVLLALTGVIVLPILMRAAGAASLGRPEIQSAAKSEVLMHTHEEFEFVANAPIDVAWPLFGAEREKVWAPGWNPIFVWPEQATDKQGMVFKLAQGDKTAIWVTTAFDPGAKQRVQYVYVIPDVVATVITLKLTPNGQSTGVSVTYERTALSAAANEIVRHMAAQDKVSGPEWGKQINDYLAKPQP